MLNTELYDENLLLHADAAAWIVDGNLKIMASNDLAERIDGINNHANRLRFDRAPHTLRLQRELLKLCDEVLVDEINGVRTIILMDTGYPAFILHCRFIGRRADAEKGDPAGYFFKVCAEAYTSETDIDEEALSEIGLSCAELRMARGLANGHDLRSVAANHSISYETARKHIRSIFLKTGINRQSELVRFLSHVRKAV